MLRYHVRQIRLERPTVHSQASLITKRVPNVDCFRNKKKISSTGPCWSNTPQLITESIDTIYYDETPTVYLRRVIYDQIADAHRSDKADVLFGAKY